MKYYKVGGCVRDEIMGVKSKDIDYVCVADDYKFYDLYDHNVINKESSIINNIIILK